MEEQSWRKPVPVDVGSYKHTQLTTFYYTVLYNLGVVGILGFKNSGERSFPQAAIIVLLIVTLAVLTLSGLYQVHSTISIDQGRRRAKVEKFKCQQLTNWMYFALQALIILGLTILAVVALASWIT
jgi:hypothetical protein